MKKNYLILFILIVLSCTGKKHNNVDLYKYLIDKTFIRLDTIEGQEVVYKSCYASIPSFKFLDNSFIWDIGQETNTLYLSKIDSKNTTLKIAASYSKNENNLEVLLFELDTLNNTLSFDGYNYVYEVLSNNYPYVEQPCKECFEEKYCNGIKEIENIKGVYQGFKTTYWTQNIREHGEIDVIIEEKIKLNIISSDSIFYQSNTQKSLNISYPKRIGISGRLISLEKDTLKIKVEEIYYDSILQKEKTLKNFEIILKDGQSIYLNGDILYLDKGGFEEESPLQLKKMVLEMGMGMKRMEMDINLEVVV